jgi:hypothetical protein
MEEAGPILSYRIADAVEVYSNVDQKGLNLRPILLYCQYCHYQITLALAGAQCVKCHSNLITFIAHNNELARPNS